MKAMKSMVSKCLLASAVLGWTWPAQAGWVQTDQDGARMYIQAGKVKEVPDQAAEGWLVMDYANQRLLVFHPEQQVCAESSFNEYCDTMQVLMDAMKKAMAAFEGEMGEEVEPPRVQVKEMGPGGKIAGFETTKYQVVANGELYEELWLTSDTRLMQEIGSPQSLQGLVKCMKGMEEEVESDPAYIDMITSGWVLKDISYELGGPEVESEVISLEKKDLPESEFTLPAGCRKVGLGEIMGGGE